MRQWGEEGGRRKGGRRMISEKRGGERMERKVGWERRVEREGERG